MRLVPRAVVQRASAGGAGMPGEAAGLEDGHDIVFAVRTGHAACRAQREQIPLAPDRI